MSFIFVVIDIIAMLCYREMPMNVRDVIYGGGNPTFRHFDLPNDKYENSLY
jgi:hypothetical protein